MITEKRREIIRHMPLAVRIDLLAERWDIPVVLVPDISFWFIYDCVSSFKSFIKEVRILAAASRCPGAKSLIEQPYLRSTEEARTEGSICGRAQLPCRAGSSLKRLKPIEVSFSAPKTALQPTV